MSPDTVGALAREIIQTVPTPLVVVDAELRIHSANDAFELAFNAGRDPLVGRRLTGIGVPGLAEPHVNPLLKALDRSPATVEITAPAIGNTPSSTILLEARPLKSAGAVPLLLISLTDVTAVRQADVAIASERLELERSNAALAEFAHAASHDLQEPLRKIIAFTDRIVSRHADGLSTDARSYLDRISAAALRMRALTDGLLLAARASAEPAAFEQVDLGVIARDVLQDLETQVTELGATVQLADLPVIEADAFQMRQLLQNLIANALKFHRPGVAPTVSISAERAGAAVVLRVTDDGIGFAPQYRERIFGMFMRLHPRSEYPGSGLGLSLCRTIALRHGGSVAAVSEPGKGSTFAVTLPVAQSSSRGVRS